MTETSLDGRRQWICTLVDQHEGELLRYAQRMTGSLEAARDIVQETFLRLCRQSAEAVRGHEREWLFRVCRHRAIDFLRKETRMPTASLDESREPGRSPPPDAALSAGETAQQVYRVLGGLSANQQEVVRLKFQNGLSYKEISAVTELSVSNVGFLLHTALQKIRAQLAVEESPA